MSLLSLEHQKTTAKLFMNGRSQAVRLPAFCRFEGQEVFIEKVGDKVILSPYRHAWADYFNHEARPTEDFMQTKDGMIFSERAQFE